LFKIAEEENPMAKRKPDFSGWATKYNIKCSDGRTILPGAFSDMDGKKVPIVFGHIHDDPDMVLGHAYLFSRPEGIWTEGYFNGNPKAKSTMGALQNGDLDGLSIYANELKHVNGRQVQHGNIRELSVVLAGANKGATIENVLLAHGDLIDELDDEAIIYGDDAPLWHDEDTSKKLKKAAEEEDEEEEEESEEDKAEDSDDAEEGEEEDEDMTDEKKKTLKHSEEEEGEEDGRTVQDIWDSMTEEQKNVCYYMIGEAMNGGADDDDDEDGDEAEHSEEEDEDDMKTNVFDRNSTPAPEDILSHADQAKIIERGVKLGSMKAAWEEALETNETLSHDVFNDDGTKQTYGIANIDYLFPDYYELNDRPDFIRRPDDWVNVVLNGVYKTPKARLRTTHANITMDEARAKGYVKGNRKEEEVFNLLRRTVDPQTIYKKQKFDRDDIIDIDDFDVIAWVKVEMRDMLNEEIARAILLGDGRQVSDPDKIFENHIKPIVNDDDLYAVKVAVTAGQTADITAKNAIRAMIKNRKFYKGSGNIIFFTSEDWLSEWLLLEDNFGHELYKDATELAKKLRVNRIVTVPFIEDMTGLIGIAVDLKDYATGTNRRGQVEFFDDFDIDFNQYKYLIETRLSGMLRKPYSAMILSTSGAPTYTEAEPVGTENPKNEGWYELEGTVYRKSADTTVIAGKTYYERTVS
jgi:HK97 family phage prohead protease